MIATKMLRNGRQLYKIGNNWKLLRQEPLKQQQKRNAATCGYHGYREPNYNPDYKFERNCALFLGTMTFGWIFYRTYYDYGHLIGEYSTPDTSMYTDEELGVPPDDEGLAPIIPNVRTTLIPGANYRNQCFEPYILDKFFGDTGVYKM